MASAPRVSGGLRSSVVGVQEMGVAVLAERADALDPVRVYGRAPMRLHHDRYGLLDRLALAHADGPFDRLHRRRGVARDLHGDAVRRGSSSSWGRISLTMPSRYASCAVIGSPVMSICSARPGGRTRGSSAGEPPPAASPIIASGWPKVAFSEAMMKSVICAISEPPPYAMPLTAAKIGFRSWRSV